MTVATPPSGLGAGRPGESGRGYAVDLQATAEAASGAPAGAAEAAPGGLAGAVCLVRRERGRGRRRSGS